MKKTIIFITLLHCIIQSNAQLYNEVANEMKYWKLRGRLIGDENNRDIYNGFMLVGNGEGESIPADKRSALYDRNYYHFNNLNLNPDTQKPYECASQKIYGIPTFAKYIPPDYQVLDPFFSPIIDPRDGKDIKGYIEFGDNPLILIGDYLAVLATEYKLLKMSNADCNQTLKEIYYALLALDRLDLKGETLYGISDNKNGFMKRGDIPRRFALDKMGKKYDITFSSRACENIVNETDINPQIVMGEPCETDAIVPFFSPHTTNKYKAAMSQDEVIGLLYGLAYVSKYVDFFAQYNGTLLHQQCAAIATRVTNYVKNDGHYDWWLITDPKDKKAVCRGAFGVMLSYALARTAGWITLPYTNDVDAFQNGWSSTIGRTIWEAEKNILYFNNVVNSGSVPPPNTLMIPIPNGFFSNGITTTQYQPVVVKGHGGHYNVSMILKLATAGRCGRRIAPGLPLTWDFKGRQTINSIAQTYHKNIYDLAGASFSNYNPVLNTNYWRDEFNYLKCSGNCIQGNNANGFYDCEEYQNVSGTDFSNNLGRWNLSNRWADDKIDESVLGQYQQGILAEYNGLDYMLAYNLYRIKKGSGYRNLIRRKISNGTLPVLLGSTTVGNVQYPTVNKAVYSFEISSLTLNPTAKATYYAGSNITLKPGLKILPGAVFKAEIKPYDCTPTPLLNGYMNKTVDSSLDITYWDQSDTSDDWDYVEEDTLDSGIPNGQDTTSYYEIRYSPNNDTVWFDLKPNYTLDSNGYPIYTPQNKLLNPSIAETTFKNLRLYPNPSDNHCKIDFTLYYDSEIKIEIYNQLGQKISHVLEKENWTLLKGKQEIKINTSSLSSGVYYCNIYIDGHKEVKKFNVLHE